jgi:hypothetical protein|tara:strand:+ start:442 stop:1122 length:681 start_codon:yes stop_codon:yes gene_type:complete
MKATKGFAKYFADTTNPALVKAITDPNHVGDYPSSGSNGTFGFGHTLTAREQETQVVMREVMESFSAQDFGKLMEKDIAQAFKDTSPDGNKYSPTRREREMLVDAHLKGNSSPAFTEAVLEGNNKEALENIYGGEKARLQFFNVMALKGEYGSEAADKLAQAMPNMDDMNVEQPSPEQIEQQSQPEQQPQEQQPQQPAPEQQAPQALSDQPIPLQLNGTLGMLSGQ